MQISREAYMQNHPGIRIHGIPAEGTGGLIVAVGFSVLFLLSVPSFAPIVAACVVGGFGLAFVRAQLEPLPATQLSGAAPLFLAGVALTLLVSPGFSALVAACLTGGVVAAYFLNRATLSRRPVSIRPTSS